MFILAIIIPKQYFPDNNIFDFPNRFYTNVENSLYLLSLSGNQENNSNTISNSTKENVTQSTCLITFLVTGTTNTLNVRDIPSTINCKILDNVANGDSVRWFGDFAFGKSDNDKSEPWVKIVTNNGIEGWARLSFLVPKNNEKFIFTAIKK